MQIIKRSGLIFNQIIFIFLSLVYLHISFSLDADVSAVSLDLFVNLIRGIPFVAALGIIAMLSILFIRKSSVFFLSLFTLVIIYKTFSVFLISYSKLLLILNVIYLISAYNMILLLKEELKQALYHPLFLKNSLDVEKYRNLQVNLNVSGVSYLAHITNMDASSLVIKLIDKVELKGKIDFSVVFSDQVFTGTAVVGTRFNDGYGLRVIKRKKSPGALFWQDFYNICYRRGYSN